MKSMKYLGSVLFSVIAVAALSGCEIDAGLDVDPGPVVVVDDTGSLTIGFSVDGRDDGLACDDFGVTAADIEVFDDFGGKVADVQVDCNDFVASVELPEGDYSVDVTLVDDLDDARSTTATVDGLEVIEDTDLEADVDFPASAMY